MLSLLYYSFGDIRTTVQAVRAEKAATYELLFELAIIVGYFAITH